mgnify:CR=1 FL=1
MSTCECCDAGCLAHPGVDTCHNNAEEYTLVRVDLGSRGTVWLEVLLCDHCALTR